MRLCVFGGTGGMGSNVIRMARSKGYDVTVLARRPEVLENPFPDIKVVRGDVFKPETIKAVVEDSDAVISTIGGSGQSRETSVYSVGVLNIAKVMQELGKRRLIVAAALLGFDPEPDLALGIKILTKLILQPALGYQYRDTAKMKEKIIKTDSPDWTLVGLPGLTNGEPKGSFRSSLGRLHHPSAISRADVASYLVSIIDQKETFRQWKEVSW